MSNLIFLKELIIEGGEKFKDAWRKQLTHTSQAEGFLGGKVSNVADGEGEKNKQEDLDSSGMSVRKPL